MIDIIAMILGIIGTVLLTRKKPNLTIIFILYLMSNTLFIIYSMVIYSYGIFGLNLIYLFLSAKGIITDRIKYKKESERRK
jgi:hypothetical protein